MDGILKRSDIERKDLNFRCPRNIRDRIAEELIGESGWFHVGRKLKVSDSKLKSIPLDNVTLPKPEDKAVATLDAWDAEKGSEATCLKLAEALYDRKMIKTLEILCQEVNSKITSESATTPEPNTSTPVSLQHQRNQRRQEGKVEEYFCNCTLIATVIDIFSHLHTYETNISTTVIPNTRNYSLNNNADLFKRCGLKAKNIYSLRKPRRAISLDSATRIPRPLPTRDAGCGAPASRIPHPASFTLQQLCTVVLLYS